MDMQYFVTDNIKDFKCIADKCPDTCCSGWLIEVDEKSLEKYSKVAGDYKKVIDERIDCSEKVFRQKANGDCSFLCENKLCNMYSVLGEEYLCDTCRLYPRHIEEFENVREMTLSISCPEVARQLMKRTDPVIFEEGRQYFEKESDCAEVEVFEDFDRQLYEKLLSAREDMLAVLKNREHSYESRAKQVISMASELQDELDDVFVDSGYGDLEPEHNRDYADECSSGSDNCGEFCEALYELSESLFGSLHELEHLKEEREEELLKAEAILFDCGEECWKAERCAFREYCHTQGINLEIMREQLATYYICAYFCGAVYDDYVFAKAFGAIANTLLIENMWLAKWIELGHQCSEEDIVRIVYEYARELENSNPNLIKMDEMMDEYITRV